jgi:hypothetical protein
MVGGEFLRFYGVELEEFPGWENDDSADPDDPHDVRAVDTNYIAIGAWYLSEIDLTDEQKQIIDTYKNRKPEVVVGNSIFIFSRSGR